MKKQSVGGQAVIEGVMMQSKNYRAIAVRKSNGEIELKKERIKSWVQDKKIDKIPFLRGAFVLFETMIQGMKSLNYSSEFFMDDEEEEDVIDKFLKKVFKDKANNAIMAVSLVLAMLLSVVFFLLIPTTISGLCSWFIKNNIVLNLIEGLIRISILILYMWAVSKNEDIKRTFMYHGAEHKVIYCYENNLELTVENAKKFTTLHARCGTNFLFIVMFTSIILFSFFGWPNILARLTMRILCMPIVAGISYEIIKFLGKYNNILSKIVAYPGMMLQPITTKEPNDEQLEVAIKALKAVI